MDLDSLKAVEAFTLALLVQQVQRIRGIIHEYNSIFRIKYHAKQSSRSRRSAIIVDQLAGDLCAARCNLRSEPIVTVTTRMWPFGATVSPNGSFNLPPLLSTIPGPEGLVRASGSVIITTRLFKLSATVVRHSYVTVDSRPSPLLFPSYQFVAR